MAGDPLKKGRYTEYSNKIGLFDKSEKQFIGNSPEVVLSFPFKDAVLEAGMTKEDAGREERFLNIKIDAKDIDTLEDPKVLTNFKYIDKDGEKELDENSDIEFFDENGELKQNLLIKGNNLLALHTLKENLAGKIKLIYIDPPYNTGSDGFKYNDNFNHSSWLTFMKNRLEVARELLSTDGSIFIQCDENEQAYLKVLCDEIYGIENFVNCICVKMSEATGVKMSHADKKLPKIKEYVLVYKKKNLCFRPDRVMIPAGEMGVNYKNVVVGASREELDRIRELMNKDTVEDKDIEEFDKLVKGIKLCTFSEINKNWGNLTEDERRQWKEDNAYRIVREVASASAKRIADQKKQHVPDDFFGIKTANGKLYFIKNHYNENAPDPNIKLIFAIDYLYVKPCDLWTDIKTTRVDREGGVQFKNGKKPEKLLERIILLASDPDDIILDYHLGSGSTCAVAHKLKRRWVGVEQMDYIETHAKKRLIDVINGDQSGISDSAGWTGGGSFVYCELKKYNQDFIDRIMEAITIPELEEIYEDMQKNAFLKFFFDKNEFEKDENFRSKSLDERKELLVGILDENQFYLNLSEMNDTKYKVADAERVLTEKFYQIKEDEVEDVEE